MREYFEEEFDRVCENFHYVIGPLAQEVAEITVRLFIWITVPFWVIPYAVFFRKSNEEDEEEL